MSRGLLLFAHGAREPAWARPFEEVGAQVRSAAPELVVELAFLEFMSPGLEEAGRRLAAAGCRDVTIVPLFLGAGGHVRKDVPALLAGLQSAFPGVRWHLSHPIGESSRVVAAMVEAALDALAASGAKP